MIICAITGHTGVLGSNFIKNNPDIKFIKFNKDLSKKNDIKKWIKKNSFDYFLHLGAVVPTYQVKKNYNYAKKVNYFSTVNIINELKKKNKKIWFFYSSSSHVYGYSNKKLNERSKTNPINQYGKLKLLSEQIIKKKLKNSKIKFCIGRIFSFTHYNQDKSFFIPSIFQNKAKIVDTFRDFIDVRDICSSIKILMNNNKVGIFNIASGKKINLIKIFEIILKKKILYKLNPKNNIFADISKIKKMRWKPQYNINDIIRDYKKNYKK